MGGRDGKGYTVVGLRGWGWGRDIDVIITAEAFELRRWTTFA